MCLTLTRSHERSSLSETQLHAFVPLLCTEFDQTEDSNYWEFIFEILSKSKSLDVERTVNVHVRFLEPLNRIINFHLRSNLRALSNDNH